MNIIPSVKQTNISFTLIWRKESKFFILNESSMQCLKDE